MDCNLELRLQPMTEMSSASPKEKDVQQLTIFYDGRVSFCDVTEFQARAIILHARREMEEKLKTPPSSEPSSPLQIQSHIYSPTGLSMKRSLQRFLQKRKCRIQTMSPYRR